MVMETIEGRPYWFGMSLPRQNDSLLGKEWWCILALLVFVHHHHGGMRSVVWCLVVLVDPRYVYEGRHHPETTEEEPISAVALIMEMRTEREERRKALVVVFPAMIQRRPITPLDDRQWIWDQEEVFA